MNSSSSIINKKTITISTIKELIIKKEEIEKEIKQITELLNEQGLGLKGNLIDKEGFPIYDMEKILTVRQLRNKLAHLQTDHLHLMKQIENDLQTLHSNYSIKQENQKNVINETIIHTIDTNLVLCIVNEIFSESPAEKANLKKGDLILQFGSIKYNSQINNNLILKHIAELVNNSEGRPIRVIIKRIEENQEFILTLTLTPKKWEGKGLLGCHLLPYTKDIHNTE